MLRDIVGMLKGSIRRTEVHKDHMQQVSGEYWCGCLFGPIRLKDLPERCLRHDRGIVTVYQVPPVRKHIINVPRKEER